MGVTKEEENVMGDDVSASADASEAVPVAANPVESKRENTTANTTVTLSPFEVLKKRMAGIAKMAREMLGGPKKNITASSSSGGASGGSSATEEEEGNDSTASGASGGSDGASG